MIAKLMKSSSDSRCTGVIFCPDPDELVEMVSAQDGRVSRQVVEVVHDDGDEQVQHLGGRNCCELINTSI